MISPCFPTGSSCLIPPPYLEPIPAAIITSVVYFIICSNILSIYGIVKVRKSGKVKIYCPGSRHNTGSKNAKFNRKNRKGNSLSKADHNRLKNLI